MKNHKTNVPPGGSSRKPRTSRATIEGKRGIDSRKGQDSRY